MAEFTAAVVGAGTMGSGIAQKIAQEGVPVTIVDVTQKQVDTGYNKIKTMLDQGVKRGVFTQKYVDDTLSRVSLATDYSAIKDVDFVVEAVFEDLKVKQDVMKKLDAVCKPETILGSNTSSLYIKDIAEATNRPDKVLGTHYFFHPAKNRLLEIIAHDGTTDETIQIAKKFSDLTGKTAIFVKDSPGFAVNRFFVPWLTEGVKIYEEGIANKATIDKAAEEAFQIGMGPFALMNATGIPIALHSAESFERELSPFYKAPQTLVDQVENGDLWDVKDGEIDRSKFDEVSHRLLATSIGAAAKLVDEGGATVEDINRGAIVGLKWRLGPFQLANEFGVENVYKWTQEMAAARPGFPEVKMLQKQAESGKPFEFRYVDYDKVGGKVTITINRPEAMNALNYVVVGQLRKAFDKAEADPEVKTIIFKGAGKAFVAGADLKFFVENVQNKTLDNIVDFTRDGHKLFRDIETSNKYTIAVLDGLSLGGGSELALSAQAVVATDKGTFGFPESGLGIYPGYGGMLRFNKQVGKEIAKYFVLTGKTVSAQEAFELGIVTKFTEPTKIDEAITELVAAGKNDKYHDRETPAKYQQIVIAFSDENIAKTLKGEHVDGVDDAFIQKVAKTISHKSPNSVKVIPEIIDKQTDMTIDEGIDYELSQLKPMFAHPEAKIGLEASVGGYRPDFSSVTAN